MRGSDAASFLLLIASCFFFLLTHARRHIQPAAASCIPKERDALLDFKHALDDPQHLLSSWQRRHDCCSWYCVRCNPRTGNVLKLDLTEVTGDDPDSAFGGQISPSLLYLEHLEYLDLGWINQTNPNSSSLEFLGSMRNLKHLHLSGTIFSGNIPPQFSNLSKLEYLDLSGTSFSGRVPPELGNISNLQHLDLGDMQGVIYSLDISWLTRLHSLEYIDMSFVNLSMVVDWLHVLNMIPSMKVLNLANCSLPSPSQLLGHLNLTRVVYLDLSSNHFHHLLASCWFWNVTTIEYLVLSDTYLYGPFPNALESPDFLDLSYNHLTGHIPSHIANMTWLDLSYNHLTGHIPSHIANMTYLDLSYNHLTGHIPSHIANITYLDLSGNNLTGAIPREIGNSTMLTGLYLRSNQLSGQIPVLPRSLKLLDMSSNFISGPLLSHSLPLNIRGLILSSNSINGKIPPSICKLQELVILDVSDNFFEGAFPQCLQMMPALNFLQLSYNSFSHMFPSFIQSSSSLAFLDLSWNNFNGTVPIWIGEMEGIQFLLLSHNMFNGHIPISITSLRQLRYLNLAGNNLSGAIPAYLSNLTAMTNEHLTEENDHLRVFYSIRVSEVSLEFFPVVIKRQELKYGSGFFDLAGIDLSQNQLTGGIPEQITSLKGLINLNLSSNHLIGQIPENIGDMKSLESLDLSWNNFHGEIPPSLSSLSYLGYMDLSYNNLTGQIPSGRHLDTLYTGNPSMYDGNSGLCGPPLQRSCSGSIPSETGIQITRESYSESAFFYLGLGSGFTVGLWAVFCALLFNQRWRVRWYRLFDSVYDRGLVFVIVTWARLARRSTAD